MSDADARRAAVDVTRSLIVQAPAGSGKTTLLVERYLRLLARVDAPEAIVAITFTRKAAGEMRERILKFLAPEFVPASHEEGAGDAAAALSEKLEEWQLLANPQRLIIRTIDSFNHYLARSMPVATMLGPVPAPTDDATRLYRMAARCVLRLVSAQDEAAQHVEALLVWLDQDSQRAENILTDVLASREQWLRAFGPDKTLDREQAETLLTNIVEGGLRRADRLLRDAMQRFGFSDSELAGLLAFARQTLIDTDKAAPDFAFGFFPGPDVENLAAWNFLSNRFLKGKRGETEFYKSITVSQGWLKQTPEKDRFLELLSALSQDPRADEIASALDDARGLPSPAYADDEWHALESLVEVLRRSAAELALVFAESGQADFSGIAAAALEGLGDPDSPGGVSDLGLTLDHRISHLLVDEFQDTNQGQIALLEKLTAGWQPGDGRTLFAVGDPMQSIYRFREADVGLFLNAIDSGIGGLPLDFVQLTRNFRSRSEIVDWVNESIGPIFPEMSEQDAVRGAVTYARSEPGLGDGGRVDVEAFATDAQEAAHIVSTLQAAFAENQENPAYRAAIIVSARSHLTSLLPALAEAGIAYRALKLGKLTDQPEVGDLLSLTKLMLNPRDRTALMGLLRSPMIGLTLADLVCIAGDGRDPWQVRDDESLLAGLAAGAADRFRIAMEALVAAQDRWRRRPVAEVVEGLWRRLGGPELLALTESQQRNVRRYLSTLSLAEADGSLSDWHQFLARLSEQRTEGDPDRDDVKLDVLTMHSAKGLEWDLVFLPGLNRKPGSGGTALVHWQTTPDNDMLVAPINSRRRAKSDKNPLIELMRREEEHRTEFERQRLLYVAATRAKSRLVLSGRFDTKLQKDEASESEEIEIKATKRSLAAVLWRTCSAGFSSAFTPSPVVDSDERELPDQSLRRFAFPWRPTARAAFEWTAPRAPSLPGDEIEFNWAGADARRIGTVLHRLLEWAGRLGIENVDAAEQTRLLGKVPRLLAAQGLRVASDDVRVAIVREAFEATLADPTGRWLLSGEHSEADCELAVSGQFGGETFHRVIDRTFVDEDDVRWIIDFKSSHHEGGDVESFYDSERERYAAQLSTYADLMHAFDGRRTRCALYLPRMQKLLEL